MPLYQWQIDELKQVSQSLRAETEVETLSHILLRSCTEGKHLSAAVIGIPQKWPLLSFKDHHKHMHEHEHTHSNPNQLCCAKLKMNLTTICKERSLLPLLSPSTHFSSIPKINQINWLKTFHIYPVHQWFSKCGHWSSNKIWGLAAELQSQKFWWKNSETCIFILPPSFFRCT